jgi:hypothetical protein
MDPYAMNETFTTAFLAHINEPLVRRLPDLGLEPGLAERWERLTDTLWRFHLRCNVTFHEGEPFNAADVVFSLERVRKPGSAMLARIASIRAASAIDPHTVEIETDGPAPTLLADLTNILILSRRWAEANGAEDPVDIRARRENHAARHANGTGPFRLQSYSPGERTVLVRNDAWWDKMEGNLREVVLQPVGSDPTRVAAPACSAPARGSRPESPTSRASTPADGLCSRGATSSRRTRRCRSQCPRPRDSRRPALRPGQPPPAGDSLACCARALFACEERGERRDPLGFRPAQVFAFARSLSATGDKPANPLFR